MIRKNNRRSYVNAHAECVLSSGKQSSNCRMAKYLEGFGEQFADVTSSHLAISKSVMVQTKSQQVIVYTVSVPIAKKYIYPYSFITFIDRHALKKT